jgi:hypothetical protein
LSLGRFTILTPNDPAPLIDAGSVGLPPRSRLDSGR